MTAGFATITFAVSSIRIFGPAYNTCIICLVDASGGGSLWLARFPRRGKAAK